MVGFGINELLVPIAGTGDVDVHHGVNEGAGNEIAGLVQDLDVNLHLYADCRIGSGV